MNFFTDQDANLVIPLPEVVGQAVTIRMNGETYLISHHSIFKVSPMALAGGEYPICFDGWETEEEGHFPNPMVKFKCLRISKISFYGKTK